MQTETFEYSIWQLDTIAHHIKEHMKSCKVVTLTGPLGAGKTTLVKRILAVCGVQDVVTSPTFTYVNMYSNKQGQIFYHFDLYRISDVDAFCSAGFDEYLYQDKSWTLIEWPEAIQSLLTHDVCAITIAYHEDASKRIATLTCTNGK